MTASAPSPFARRTVLGAAAAGALLPVAACGSDASEDSSATTRRDATGEVRFTASEIPVGGGTISATDRVVVTQPTEGDFKAFSAVCPHQQCVVSAVTEGTIVCACHNSTFDAGTGDQTGGPAPAGLEELTVTEDGADVVVGGSS